MDNEEKKLSENVPETAYDTPEIDNDDDAPTEWVPSRFEKRIHAIPEAKWNLYQILGGGLIGLIAVAGLCLGGTGVTPGFLVAVVLALLLPNWLEDRGRRKLNKARIAMIVVLAVGLIAMTVYTGMTQGWSLTGGAR